MPSELSNAWGAVRGLTRLSLCDWPGRASAVLFFGGCNLRCPTCHNTELAFRPERLPAIFPHDVHRFLTKRAPWLDGVVVTGGEPTCVPGIVDFARELAAIGLPVKLDSNGMRPRVLAEILDAVPDITFAVDVKGPWRLYPELTGRAAGEDDARARMGEVLAMAERAPQRFYFRITKVPGLTADDVAEAAAQLPEGFTLIEQKYVDPGRSYAHADQEEGRSTGDLVHPAHRRGDSQGAEGQRHQGSAHGRAHGAQSGDQARGQ